LLRQGAKQIDFLGCNAPESAHLDANKLNTYKMRNKYINDGGR